VSAGRVDRPKLPVEGADVLLTRSLELVGRDQTGPRAEDGDEGEEEERLLLTGGGHGGRMASEKRVAIILLMATGG
jgi:hypothetical protein